MSKEVTDLVRFAKIVVERATLYVLALLAVSALVYTATSAFGLTPWLSLSLNTAPTAPRKSVRLCKGVATFLLIGLCTFIPNNARVSRLEHSHRRFEMNMQDVARAYYVAHAQDRAGLFNMQSEFDSVRERIAHLRDHPDLDQMEPQILELAAQMSHVSRDLANTYSDEKVQRATKFLTQREEEISQFNTRIDQAKTIVSDIRRWNDRLDLDESVARSQLISLRNAFEDALPELADFERPTVVEAAPKVAANAVDPAQFKYPFATAAE